MGGSADRPARFNRRLVSQQSGVQEGYAAAKVRGLVRSAIHRMHARLSTPTGLILEPIGASVVAKVV